MQDATFTILGGDEPIEIPGSGNMTSVSVDLPPGEYLVRLEDGWRLQHREEGESWSNIEAVLLSSNPQAVVVSGGDIVEVAFRFGVGDSYVEMGLGRVNIVIEVEDESSPGGDDSCDPLLQNCAPGEGCFLDILSGDSICATPVPNMGAETPGTQGDLCSFLNSCEVGYNCSLPESPGEMVDVCAFFCDAGGGGGPGCNDGPGPAFTCVAIDGFYGDTEYLDDNLGFCVDCTVWAGNPECE